MKEKDLPIDRSRHAIYTKKAKQCVQKLLHRYYDEKTASELWEKIQLQYAEFLKDEPALGGVKMTVSIYDPILIFAWYVTVPEKPPLEDVQQDVYDCFMSGFDVLGKVFDLNRRLDNRLANKAFQRANDLRENEIKSFPASFRMGYYAYDRANCIVRYSFTQCPNAEFAKRHHLEAVLPLMCNCDHLAMRKLHATLIREGTCGTSECCDYCIVGDRNPLAANYENVKNEQGLIISRKKNDPQRSRKMFGEKSGFQNVFYPKKKGEYRMDVVSCPYNRYFTELGCPELTKISCGADDHVYGDLPGLKFERTTTIGRGGKRCDFCIRKV